MSTDKAMVTLDDLTVKGGFDQKVVEDRLRRYGAAVLPAYVQGDMLEKASRDWSDLRKKRNDDIPGIRRVGGDAADYAALDRDIVKGHQFPAIETIFANDNVKSLVKNVVGFPCMMNSEIYATYDVGKDQKILDAHFDKSWNLKFMLYLDDNLETAGGAFGVHPCSMPEARKRFRAWFDSVSQNGAIDVGTDQFYTMPNKVLPDNLLPFVEILAPAGTLTIFSTDVYHSGSLLKEGGERRILRAHTYPGLRLLGIGDKMLRHSRHYERGEAWETMGRTFSVFSKTAMGEFAEQWRVYRKATLGSAFARLKTFVLNPWRFGMVRLRRMLRMMIR